MNCVSNAHDLGPFAVLSSTTAAAPRIYSSTADKLLPGSRFDMRQMFATSPVVGGDANTVLEVVSGFLLCRVSVSLEQCVFMQEGK